MMTKGNQKKTPSKKERSQLTYVGPALQKGLVLPGHSGTWDPRKANQRDIATMIARYPNLQAYFSQPEPPPDETTTTDAAQ